MANILDRLLKSVNRKDPIQGKVVSVNGNVVIVSTVAGIKEVGNLGATNLRAGDTVKINGSSIIGRIGDDSELMVYRL